MSVRRFAAGVALLLTMSACNIGVDVSTVVRSGGDGRFHVTFSFDKEFVEVVSTSVDGKKSLQALRSVGTETTPTGWTIRSSAPAGGLAISIDRHFDDPASLNRAIETVANQPQQGSLAVLNIFRGFRLRHSRSFLKTTTDVSGVVDLAPERLAPGFSKVKPALRQALQQAAGRVFSFHVSVKLPGRISRFTGSPERVDGSAAKWAAPFGKTLSFSAHASGVRYANLALAGGPLLALLLIGLLWLLRLKRLRAAPVEGWEVNAAAPSVVPQDQASKEPLSEPLSEPLI
ncbi:MAG: hypothetical protein NVSMB57_10420 [Actinomycetota bacterium]